MLQYAFVNIILCRFAVCLLRNSTEQASMTAVLGKCVESQNKSEQKHKNHSFEKGQTSDLSCKQVVIIKALSTGGLRQANMCPSCSVQVSQE